MQTVTLLALTGDQNEAKKRRTNSAEKEKGEGDNFDHYGEGAEKMKYRPEYRLDRLRMMMLDDSSGSNARREGEPLLHLPWLRTMVVDLSHTAERDVDERLALQQRSAVGCAVERVVCKDLGKEHLPQLLSFVTQCVAPLTSLVLRGCEDWNVDNDFLLRVADAHSSSLRRLYLPSSLDVTQSTLDHFTQLEELDVTWCKHLTNVDFCSATLRVLYANYCSNLTDAGLRRATRLEVLHVSGCSKITDVSPFAHCLLELDASCSDVTNGCGIGSAALSNCSRLQVLNVHHHSKITTLQPFAEGLRELSAGGRSNTLNDAALADATGLVSLSARFNQAITTVEPFGASLRRLDASHSNIDDAGLVTASNLVYLDAADNDNIGTLAPFSAQLLELGGMSCLFVSSISQTALSAATNLIWLDVSYSEQITTVQSCSRSLRHLVAWGSICALTNEGLCTATQLVTLDCNRNPNLTTMEPFLHSLEELTTDSIVMLQMVADAALLHRVVLVENDEDSVDAMAIEQMERNGFVRRNENGDWVRHVTVR